MLDFFSYKRDLHPCEDMPIFLPGEVDAGDAALNDAQAIDCDPSKLWLTYLPAAERDPVVAAALEADGKPSGDPCHWYRQYEPCIQYDGIQFHCDEYPFYASHRSGPPTTDTHFGGSRISVAPADQNTAEGNAHGSFTRACGRVKAREPFLVVPLVAAASTDWICPP